MLDMPAGARLARTAPPAPAPTTTGPGPVDNARGVGRGSVRPTLGDGVGDPQITQAPGMPGFPTPPPAPRSGDGSGTHGVRSASIGDRLFEQVAHRLADAADAIGLNNAARNMRHYLDNTGAVQTVDPAMIQRDLPGVARAMDGTFQTNIVQAAANEVRDQYQGQPMQFQITEPWKVASATKPQSQDWFFALGSFSYAHTADVRVTPNADGSAHVEIRSQLNIFDRYNWDAGKSVTIGPITVTDEQMGRLHDVGLAREFEVRGTSTGPSASFDVR